MNPTYRTNALFRGRRCSPTPGTGKPYPLYYISIRKRISLPGYGKTSICLPTRTTGMWMRINLKSDAAPFRTPIFLTIPLWNTTGGRTRSSTVFTCLLLKGSALLNLTLWNIPMRRTSCGKASSNRKRTNKSM